MVRNSVDGADHAMESSALVKPFALLAAAPWEWPIWSPLEYMHGGHVRVPAEKQHKTPVATVGVQGALLRRRRWKKMAMTGAARKISRWRLILPLSSPISMRKVTRPKLAGPWQHDRQEHDNFNVRLVCCCCGSERDPVCGRVHHKPMVAVQETVPFLPPQLLRHVFAGSDLINDEHEDEAEDQWNAKVQDPPVFSLWSWTMLVPGMFIFEPWNCRCHIKGLHPLEYDTE